MACRSGWRLSVVVLALAWVGSGCGDDKRSGTPDAMMVRVGDGGDGLAPDGDGADRGLTGDGADVAGEVVADSGAAADGGDGGADAAGDGPVGAACNDNLKNGSETDVDCGGSCGRCALGRRCSVATDCLTGACNADGICVDCLVASSCPGQDSECSQRTCLGGACGVSLIPAQTVLATQTAGDCKSRRCDGQGAVILTNDDADLPDDSNACTQDLCTAGVASHTLRAQGSTCGDNRLCDGQGHCVGCVTAADCPGTDNDCRTRSCTQNLCGFVYQTAGTPTSSQLAGDCKVNDCDGNGNLRVSAQDSDLPDDGNACTLDRCTAGTPSHAPAGVGSSCGNGNICDGANHCVQCVVTTTCPGQDGPCQSRTCSALGLCGLAMDAAGTVVLQQSAGDCKRNQCDGAGHVVAVNDDNDRPVDNNVCTGDVCTAGAPSNPALPSTTTCNGANHCDGAGHCVACVTAADCPGQDTACQTRTCSAAGVCGVSKLASGTPIAFQTPGDCKVIQCDAAAAAVTVNDDGDRPVDGNVCTDDVCTGGAPSNPPLGVMTSCGGRNLCDGAGHCVGCLVAADCPGEDTACQTRTCDLNMVCGLDNVADGTPIPDPAGDCRAAQCDGRGATKFVSDPGDVPNDNNLCTQDVCGAAGPSNPPVIAGVSCGGGRLCDGLGSCVACLAAADCGVDTACQVHTCGADHACSVASVVAPGTPIATQIAGDCQVAECDAQGGLISVGDDADVPPDDGNGCTDDVCVAGAPAHPPKASGVPCGVAGLCDGAGVCAGCLGDADCGASTACQIHACGAGHTCATTLVPAGTAAGTQVAGDCKVNQCDGLGNLVAANANGDTSDDGNPCTDDLCAAGTPSHAPTAAGTACGAGLVCDGLGGCITPAGPDAGVDVAADAGAGSCPPPYIFCDDFEDGNSNGWTQIEQTATTPGTWTVAGGLGHTGATTLAFRQTGTANSYHYQVASAAPESTDQTVSAWIRLDPTDPDGGVLVNDDTHKAGVCARFTTGGDNNTTSAYCFFTRQDVGAARGRVQITKKPLAASLGGLVSTTTATFPGVTIPVLVPGTWYKMTLQVSGSTTVTLIASINDVPLVTVVDDATTSTTGPPLVSGRPGVVDRQVQAGFDDVLFSAP